MRRLLDALHAFVKSRYFYPLTFAGASVPLVLLLWRVWAAYRGDADALGVNPVETLLHEAGEDALGVLIASLAVTPIRRIFGWNKIQKVRRMLGVWSFVYALTHFSIYVIFDQVGDVNAIIEDVVKRKFIFVGMLALTILTALAITSTNGMIRRLGRNWNRLHKLVYVAVIAAAIHFVWGQKADIEEPLMWAGWIAALLAIRVFFWWRKTASASAATRSKVTSQRSQVRNL